MIIAVTLCSCGNNENNETNTNSTNYNPPIIAGDKETVTYQVNDGKVDTNSFMFEIPENYQAEPFHTIQKETLQKLTTIQTVISTIPSNQNQIRF